MCVRVCIDRNDMSWRKIVYFLLDTIPNILSTLFLNMLCRLIVNSTVKGLLSGLSESFANQLQVNGTHSYLVKITIEKLVIFAIPAAKFTEIFSILSIYLLVSLSRTV